MNDVRGHGIVEVGPRKNVRIGRVVSVSGGDKDFRTSWGATRKTAWYGETGQVRRKGYSSRLLNGRNGQESVNAARGEIEANILGDFAKHWRYLEPCVQCVLLGRKMVARPPQLGELRLTIQEVLVTWNTGRVECRLGIAPIQIHGQICNTIAHLKGMWCFMEQTSGDEVLVIHDLTV